MKDLESLTRGEAADYSSDCACPDPASVKPVKILDPQSKAEAGSRDCACPKSDGVARLPVEVGADEVPAGSGAGFNVEVVILEL